MKKIFSCLLCSMLIFELSGCGDIKDLEKLTYANAIGIDYKNGNYYTYIQSLGFSNIAKTEGASQGPPTQYIGRGVGPTLEDSLTQLMVSTDQSLYLRHVDAIILSKSTIQNGVAKIMDAITRNSELTLSPWVFGTSESIESIFSISGFFNQTSIVTILHQPTGIFDQQSNIRPKKLYELGREITEPYFTTYIPSLKINQSNWKSGAKISQTLVYDGAFFLQNNHYKGFYKLSNLAGLRWVTKGTQQMDLSVPKNKPSANIHISPTFTIYENKTISNVSIDIIIKGNGYINEWRTNKSNFELTKDVNNSIRKEVLSLYELGLKNKTDFLNLNHDLYRDDYSSWHQVGDHETLLHDVKVNIKIKHSSSNKNRPLNIKKID